MDIKKELRDILKYTYISDSFPDYVYAEVLSLFRSLQTKEETNEFVREILVIVKEYRKMAYKSKEDIYKVSSLGEAFYVIVPTLDTSELTFKEGLTLGADFVLV